MSRPIKRFTNKYAFLSNFYRTTVPYQGLTYPTSEHAFQAAKTLDPELRQEIVDLRDPMDAKNMGRSIPMRGDWEEIKVSIMEAVCLSKFTYNEDLKMRLLSTGDAHLEEGNRHGDVFWGTVNGEGRNALGFVLMRVRDKLRGPIKDSSGFVVKPMK